MLDEAEAAFPLTQSGGGTRALAVPAAFAAAAVLHVLGLGEIAHILVGGTLHEMGHATAAVLGGRWAFFVPFGFTFTGAEASPVVVLGVVAGAGGLAWWCVQERCWAFAALCGLALAALVRLTVVASSDEGTMWMVFFGCGGELLLSALLVACFFHPLPARLRWDFWRWPLMVLGALAFFEAFVWWQRMDPDLRGALGGDTVALSRESDQDMVRLVRVWHWTAAQLIRAYRGLGAAGVVALALEYVWAAFTPSRR